MIIHSDYWKNLSNQEKDDLENKLFYEFRKYNNPYYDREKAILDYKQLKEWYRLKRSTMPTYGSVCCYHFITSIMDAKVIGCRSRREIWNDDKLMKKCIRWQLDNEKGYHHIQRFYAAMCYKVGFRLVSNLSPSIVIGWLRDFTDVLDNGGKIFFDPCAGWGGRMLASNIAGMKYIAIDANKKLVEELKLMSKVLNLDAEIYYGDSSDVNLVKQVMGGRLADIICTSIPYYNREIYSDDNEQSIKKFMDYKSWKEGFLNNLWNNCLLVKKDYGFIIINSHLDLDLYLNNSDRIIYKNRRVDELLLLNNCKLKNIKCNQCDVYVDNSVVHNNKYHKNSSLSSSKGTSKEGGLTDKKNDLGESKDIKKIKEQNIKKIVDIDRILLISNNENKNCLDLLKKQDLIDLCDIYGKCKLSKKIGCSLDILNKKLDDLLVNVNKTHKGEITKEILDDLYVNKFMSDREIGEKFNMTGEGIAYQRKKFGIKTIKQEERIRYKSLKDGKKDIRTLTKKELEILYKENTMNKIAEMYGCSRTIIKRKMKEFNLKTISKSQRNMKKYPIKLTRIQKSVLLGSLMGDGNLSSTNNISARFKEAHSIKQEEYLKWKYDIFKPYSSNFYYYIDYFDGKEYFGCNFTTCFNSVFKPYYDDFYAGEHRNISEKYINDMDELCLAVWYMDDGHLNCKKASIYNNFSNVDVILKWLKEKFNLIPEMKDYHENLNTYLFTYDFFNVIEKHVVPSMRYKLPKELR